MQVVIMAGGKGTRISSINAEVPKPMIPILDKPILEYEIQCLERQGYRDIILVVGHLGHKIQDYFRDGSPFGVSISYVVEKEPLGTAGALFYLKSKIKEDFLLLNGDIIFDVNISKFVKAHRNNGTLATIFTHPNNHPYDSGVIVAGEDKKVVKWMHKEDKRHWYQNRVNAGLHMLSPALLERFEHLEKKDLDRDILKPLIDEGELAVYDSPEYVKDMGTPDRYYAVADDIRKGKVSSRNLKNKQKAVFLDRDGVINKYVGFLRDIDDFELLPGVAEAIKKLNDSGYLVIVVTNQPVIARGDVTFSQLREIHNKMETLLGKEGAYIDALYFCPHHPDRGFEGEVPELKIDCECRKPKPGMFFQASEDFNIELSDSWMVGDSESDIIAGEAAGCQCIRVDKYGKVPDLLAAINKILLHNE